MLLRMSRETQHRRIAMTPRRTWRFPPSVPPRRGGRDVSAARLPHAPWVPVSGVGGHPPGGAPRPCPLLPSRQATLAPMPQLRAQNPSVADAGLQGRALARWPGSGCQTRPGRRAKGCNRAPPLPGKMFPREAARPAATRQAPKHTCGAPVVLPGRPRSRGQAARSGAAPPGGPSSTCRPANHLLGLASKTKVTPPGALTKMLRLCR